ncbi:DUF6985 domain-containing protein [Pseudomonas sp. PDM11]|uniref:DUF6985 domain-containing protein n=1 Tax=Pseudomonas sp. PDM11 TaxID=2769309 RepID=UPI0017834518|nr:hypothetical protein [Pseudomonas sp. PDM11]MBD9396663.1 hypothetical protein [Pseudomonas sp. PDM11]
MSVSLEGIESDQYGRYVIPYKSKILEKEVFLTIPTDNGKIEEWQLTLANQFCEREESLKEIVYKSILAHYLNVADELRLRFGEKYQHLVPPVENVAQLKELLTPTGVYIGELEPTEEAIGLLFECTWEEEHGLGVLINNWVIKEVSHQDVAFTI